MDYLVGRFVESLKLPEGMERKTDLERVVSIVRVVLRNAVQEPEHRRVPYFFKAMLLRFCARGADDGQRISDIASREGETADLVREMIKVYMLEQVTRKMEGLPGRIKDEDEEFRAKFMSLMLKMNPKSVFDASVYAETIDLFLDRSNERHRHKALSMTAERLGLSTADYQVSTDTIERFTLGLMDALMFQRTSQYVYNKPGITATGRRINVYESVSSFVREIDSKSKFLSRMKQIIKDRNSSEPHKNTIKFRCRPQDKPVSGPIMSDQVYSRDEYNYAEWSVHSKLTWLIVTLYTKRDELERLSEEMCASFDKMLMVDLRSLVSQLHILNRVQLKFLITDLRLMPRVATAARKCVEIVTNYLTRGQFGLTADTVTSVREYLLNEIERLEVTLTDKIDGFVDKLLSMNIQIAKH